MKPDKGIQMMKKGMAMMDQGKKQMTEKEKFLTVCVCSAAGGGAFVGILSILSPASPSMRTFTLGWLSLVLIIFWGLAIWVMRMKTGKV